VLQVLNNQRVGHKGLGKSTAMNNVAGGKWEGTRKTFGDGGDDHGGEDHGVCNAADKPDVMVAEKGSAGKESEVQGEMEWVAAAAGGGQEAVQKREKKKRRERKSVAEAAASEPGNAAPPRGEEDAKRLPGDKQAGKKRKQSTAATSGGEPTIEVASGGAHGAMPHKPIKWLKVAKLLLKKVCTLIPAAKIGI
jgi:hypothetical protein